MTRPSALPDTQIAFIGGGHMARSLIGGLIGAGVRRAMIAVGEPEPAVAAGLIHDFGVIATADNAAVVRCMPNTPALIGSGATGMYANARASAAQREQAEQILATVGLTAWIGDESLMDAVTAVSGSGPAYFFLLVEALEDAGVAQGLPRDTARRLAIQTCLGAGRMLAEDETTEPAELRRRVTSPGGTTQAALDSFGESGFAAAVAHAVAGATRRGKELSAHFSD